MFRDVLLYQDFKIRAPTKAWSGTDILFPTRAEPPALSQRPATQFYPPNLYLSVETDYNEYTVELAQRIPRTLNTLRDLLVTAGASASVSELMDDAVNLNVNWGYQLIATNGANTFIIRLELAPVGTVAFQMTTNLILQATGNGTPITTSYDPGAATVYSDHVGHNQCFEKATEFEQVVLGELLVRAREVLRV